MKHQHPVAILRYMSNNFWLLLIPLVRGIIIPNFNFYTWFKGAYVDLAVLLVIMGSALMRWYSTRFEFREDCFAYKGGVFIRLEFELPYNIISAVSTKRVLWMRPAKAVSVFIDSETMSPMNRPNDADVHIITNRTSLDLLFDKIPNKTNSVKMSYEVPRWNLIFFSFVFSSTLSGIVFIGTFFIQGSKVVGNQLENIFFNTVSGVTEFASKVISGVTPTAVGLSIILLAGWMFSFISNLLRHINFHIQRTGRNIIIENGFFSKWKYYVNSDKINYADIRQNLLMKICRVMSVHVSCSGYGKAKNEIPVFVPITTKRRVMGSMQMLLPRFPVNEVRLKPHWNYIFRFIGPPTMVIFAVLAAGFVSVIFFPEWFNVIAFVIIMTEIPSLYMLLVKFAAYYTNGIDFTKKTLCLKYCRYFQFHSIIVPESRIALVSVKQTLFQRQNKSCDFIVYTNAEFTKSHRVKGLSLDEVLQFLKEMNIDSDVVHHLS